MENFLGAEALLIARLKVKVTGVREVLAAADLAGVAEAKQVTPALHVLFGGYRPTKASVDGRVQQTEQRWQVVVAVKNLRTPKTGEHAREEAGPLLLAVLEVLQGWRPSDEYTPFTLAAGAAPGFSRGYGYYPLAFTTLVTTRANP